MTRDKEITALKISTKGGIVPGQGRRKQFLSGTAIGYLCVRTQLHMYAGVSSVHINCRNFLFPKPKGLKRTTYNSVLTKLWPWEVVNFKG